MCSAINIGNFHGIRVIRALELKSELKAYKYEKRIARDEYGVEGDDSSPHEEVAEGPWLKKVHKFFRRYKKKTTVDRTDVVIEDVSVYHKFLHDGTTENLALKSAVGFTGGVLLTYMCYLFLIYSLNFTLSRATLICMALGIVLSLGLAFSIKIRCTVLLCIPQLFSKRGRQALLAYAFILALSGPAKNTLHNVEVMSDSLACGQEQLKRVESEIIRCIGRPNTAIKHSLDMMLANMDLAVGGYRAFIERFFKECYAVIETIIRSYEWLYDVSALCNKKMGSPYGRCTDLLFEAQRNCKAMSDSAIWIRGCDLTAAEDCICDTEDTPFCAVEDLPPFWPFLNHKKDLIEFRRKALNTVYVKLESHEVYSKQPNRTTALREEYQGMATEIRQKTDQFIQFFDLMSVIFGIFIIVLFIKVIIYRYKFLTEDEYDNRFITRDFVAIDKTRAEFGMQTVLPLEPREQKKYIKVTSMRLVPHEQRRMLSSFVFLVFATTKIVIHILLDSSLYWMLWTMRRHGRMLLATSDMEHPMLTIVVNGTGIYADLLRNVTNTVKPYAVQRILDPVPCLPDPLPPDWNRYGQILTLVAICWLLAIIEPYGLRWRHIVMVTYHPDRARERAIWLYNRILTTRINFVKFARRQLRRKYKGMTEKILYKKIFWLIKRRLRCLLCKKILTKDDESNYVKCSTAGCVGIYCTPCFNVLQICSICQDPSCYGDCSDVSEEKDSEEDIKPRYPECNSINEFDTHLLNKNGKHCSTYYCLEAKKNIQNATQQKYQISMDTIIDLNEKNHQSTEHMPRDIDTDESALMTSSILTRMINQLKKAFSLRNIKSSETTSRSQKVKYKTQRKKDNFDNVYFFSTTEDALQNMSRISVPRNMIQRISYKKNQKMKKSTASDIKNKENKQTFRSQIEKKVSKSSTLKIIKDLATFKLKFKDKLSDKSNRKQREKKISDFFKNIYFVDVDPSTGHARFSRTAPNHHFEKDTSRSSISSLSEGMSTVYCTRKDSAVQTTESDQILQVLHERTGHPPNESLPHTHENSNTECVSEIKQLVPLQQEDEKIFLDDGWCQSCRKERHPQSMFSGHQIIKKQISTKSHTQYTPKDYEHSSVQRLNSSSDGVQKKVCIPSQRSCRENCYSSSSSSCDELIEVKRRLKSRSRLNKTKRRMKAKGRPRSKPCKERYETTSDSSADAKLMKSKRAKGRIPRISIKVTDADLVLTNMAQKVLTKKMDMLKAKLTKFFRKSIKKHSSSDEIGTTDNDDYLSPPLSDAEFIDLKSRKHQRNIRKEKHLQSAPDLISDLPTAGSTSRDLHTSHSHVNFIPDSDPDEDIR